MAFEYQERRAGKIWLRKSVVRGKYQAWSIRRW
jgi:hypothetical protein